MAPNKCMLPFLPCTATCIVGPTGAGKTWWIRQFITDLPRMYEDPAPEKVLYCYGIDQPLFHDMAAQISYLTFHQGLPPDDTLEALQGHYLIVIDDLASEVVKSDNMQQLFVRGCHHRKLTVMFVLHNIYEQGKNARTIALNSQYLILFKNPRDASQIHTLGRQMFPRRPNRLIDAFEDATKPPRGYLVVDMAPTSSDDYRLRTRVFPEEYPVVYVPKS